MLESWENFWHYAFVHFVTYYISYTTLPRCSCRLAWQAFLPGRAYVKLLGGSRHGSPHLKGGLCLVITKAPQPFCP